MRQDADADLELALYAARAAGDVVMKNFRQPQHVTHKSPDQPLTDADLAADATLRRILLANRLDYGWLSEESADNPERLQRTYTWIVDPIDGTSSYIAGYPEFAISIGLVKNQRPLLGVVFNPATGELYAARAGHGAWRVDGGPAHVRTDRSRVLAASRSELRAGEFAEFGDFEIAETGSTAYKMVRVAAGHAEAFFSRRAKSEWDVCAGALIVSEAGGRATDIHGRELSYNQSNTRVDGIIASNGVLHSELVERLAALPRADSRTNFQDHGDQRENI